MADRVDRVARPAGGHVRLADLRIPRVELPVAVTLARAPFVPAPRAVPARERWSDTD